MKRIGMNKAVVIAVFGVFLLAGSLAARDTYEEKFDRTEALDRNGRVSLENISGTIEVRSWDKAEVRIDALKVSKASSRDQAKENAGLVRIEVVKEGGVLRIETKYPERRFRGNNLSVSVNYVLTIPDQASLRVKNVSGDIDVQKIGGDLDIDEVSGGVRIAGAAKTVDCKTVSGGIDCETEILPSGRYSFDALSGGITLLLPASAAFEVEAETFSGHIATDFPVVVSGKISPKELRGTVGTGGATVRIKSFSGRVEIRKK